MDKILLVEDDSYILKTNEKLLTYEGFSVIKASTAASAIEAVSSQNPALIVLDVMLPDGNGMELCRKIRAVSSVPILFLTVKAETPDKVLGFEAGGDDYMPKPYDLDEFRARIHALLRRVRTAESGTINFPPISIDLSARWVFLNGGDAGLTPKEYQMLLMLVRNAGRPIDGETLFEKLWAAPSLEDMNTVRVHISSIRKKLNMTDASKARIKNIRNSGYCFIFSSLEEI
jgi:DNA-binding response OmpR family regulator